MMTEKYNKINSSKFYRIILCFVLTLVAALFIYYRYELLLGPDDVGMRNILSGLYTGTPDAYTYFIHYPLGLLLSTLYNFFPNVYWYFWFLEVINYACLFLILYSVSRKVKDHVIIYLVLITSLFIIFWIPNLTTLEWTTSAGVLSATTILWYALLPKNEGIGKTIFNFVIPIILYTISFNIRPLVAEVAIPFLAMVFLVKLINQKKHLDKKYVRSEILFFSILAAAVFSTVAINKVAYSSEEWEEAEEFSTYRSMMYDRYGYPSFAKNYELYEENGITQEMYKTMVHDYNFMLATKGVITSEDLEDIAELSKDNFYSKQSFGELIKKCIKSRWKAVTQGRYKLYTLVFYLGMILAIVSAIRRKAWLMVILDAIFILGFESIWLYLYYGNRLPPHVGYTLYFLGFAVIIALLYKEPLVLDLWHHKVFQFFVVFLIAFLLGRGIVYMQYDNEADAGNALLLREVKQYCEENSDNVYYRDFYSFNGSVMYKELIKDFDQNTAANFIPANGWTVILPYDNQFMPSGGEQELCSWIAEQDNYYMIVRDDRAKATCARTENLFASRDIDCSLVLEDQLYISNGLVMNVYHYTFE